MKRIKFESVYNFRDLGGIPISLKQWTTRNVFFRSDLLHQLSDEEIAYLKQLNVSTIIDLRTNKEKDNQPNQLETMKDFHYYQYSFLDNEEAISGLDDFKNFYLYLIETTCVLPAIFDTLASAKGAVVYHCTAGKDRTGILSALLLMLVGVGKDDVVADYQLSDTYLTPLKHQLMKLYPDMPIQVAGTSPEWIIAVIEYIKQKDMTVETYLLNKGVSEASIKAVKEKLFNES